MGKAARVSLTGVYMTALVSATESLNPAMMELLTGTTEGKTVCRSVKSRGAQWI